MSFDNTVSDYEEKISKLEGINALLHYDQVTGMPKKAIKQRGGQLSLITGRKHTLLTEDELYETIQSMEKEHLSFQKRRRLERLKKDVEKAREVPDSFVEELAELTSEAENVWEEAKEEDDYEKFKPYLEELVEKKKQYANYIDPDKKAYNVLLDDFEEGMTEEKLSKIFEKVKPKLVTLLEKIKQSDKYKRSNIFDEKHFNKDTQRRVAKDMASRILPDEKRYQFRESAHPFTTRINPDDVRITTAIKDNPTFSVVSTVHEAGHALYELNFGEDKWRTALEDSPSFGIHESQSRFWENHVFLNKQYLRTIFPEFKEAFEGLREVSFERFYEDINQVEPGFIRTEADEVTYTLHVIIRFEIERDLFSGDLAVENLPQVWNDKYEEYLGIRPDCPSEGILQDVHWSGGSFGYFPSYSLGSIYAALITDRMKEDLDVDSLLADEEFEPIREWLREHIHQHGRMYKPLELLRESDIEMDVDVYIDYLEDKFLDIYS